MLSARPRFCPSARVAFTALLFAFLPGAVRAQTTLYWDSNGAGAGGSTTNGTWGINNFWATAADFGTSGAWVSGAKAYFGGSANEFGFVTITVSGTQTIGGMETSRVSPTINGGTLALSQTSVFYTSGILTINSVISGAGSGIIKMSANSLELSGANTYTGSTTIQEGDISIDSIANGGASSPLGASSSAAANLVLNGGTLYYMGSTATTDRLFSLGLNGAVLGAFGTGTLTFSNTGSLGFIGGGLRTFTLTGWTAASLAAVIGDNAGATSIVKEFTGTWTLSGNNSYTGSTTLAGGTLVLGSSGAIGNTGTISFTGGTLQFTASNANDYSARIVNSTSAMVIDTNGQNVSFASAIGGSNSGGLVKAGAGTLTLSGANTYSGGTTFASGTVKLGSSGALGNSGNLVFTGGGLQFSASNGTDYSTRIVNSTGSIAIDTNGQIVNFSGAIGSSNTGGLIKSGSGVLSLSGTNTYTGPTTINGGSLELSGGATIPDASAVTLANVSGTTLTVVNSETIGSLAGGGTTGGNVTLFNGALTVGGDNTSTTFAGAISGAGGALIKTGTGLFTLAGVNSYTGNTTISSGTLQFSKEASLYNNTPASWTAANLIVNPGAMAGFNVGGTGEFTTGDIDTLKALGTSGGGFRSGSLIGFDTTNATGGTFTYSGGIANPNSGSNTLSLVKLGDGMLVLAGGNTYTGGTTVKAGTLSVTGSIAGAVALNGGTLALGSSGAIGAAGNLVFGGGSLQFSAGNTADYSARIVNSTGAVAIDTNGQNVTFASALGSTNTGGLTKLGSGTLTLSGNNAYGGVTLLTGGILALGSSGALGSTGNLSFAGGTLQASASNTTDYFGRIANSTGAVAIDTNGLNPTFAGALDSSNTGGFTKAGTGTLTLTGVNAYSGPTTISTGALALGANDTLPSDTAVTVAGTFAVSGKSQTIGSLAGTGTTTLGAGGALTAGGDNTDTTFSGAVSGSATGTFTKTGTGTMTLAGTIDNSTLWVNVAQGTLALGKTSDSTHHGVANVLSVSSGATLQLAGTGDDQIFDNNAARGVNGLAGTFDLNGRNETIAQFNGSSTGVVTNSAAGTTSTLAVGNLNAASADLSFSGVIRDGAGTTVLTKIGANTLTLSGANAFTGGLTLSVGTVRLGAAGALASTLPVSLANTAGVALDLNGFNQSIGSLTGGGTTGGNVTLGSATLTTGGNNTPTTFSGVISGTGGLTKNGTGTFTPATVNTYTGITTIQNGTLAVTSLNKVSGGSASSGLGAPTTATNGAIALGTTTTTGTLLYTGAGETTDRAINLVGNGTIDSSGTGPLSFTSSVVLTGTNSKVLTLTGTNTGINTLSGALSNNLPGSSAVVKSGSGTWLLSGSRFYNAGTTINGGILEVDVLNGATSSLGIRSDQVALTINNGTLRYIGTGAGTYNGGIITGSNGILDSSGTGLLTLNGPLNALSGGPVTLTGTTDGLLAGNDADGSLTKSGSNTWTLSGTNGYTQATTINNGTLSISSLANGGASSGIGASSNAATNLVLNGGTLRYTGAATTSDRLFSVGPSGGTLDASGSGALTLSNPGSLGFNSQTGARTLTLTGTSNLSLAAIVGDNGGATSLVKTGTGTVTLSGANTFSGTTTLGSGTLALGASGALGSAGSLIFTGGTLQFSASETTDFSSRIVNSTGPIAVDTNGQSVTFASALGSSNTGGLTKSGAGTLTLAGTNAFTGATTISGGTVFIGVFANGGVSSRIGASSSAAANLVLDGGTLVYTGLSSVTSDRLFSVGNGGGTLAVTTSGRTLTLSNSGSIGFNGESGARTLTLAGAGNGVLSASLGDNAGATSLTKTGAGQWTLNGSTANTSTGATTLNGGTLKLDFANLATPTNLVSSSSPLVLGGGTLDLTGKAGAFTTSQSFAGTTINPGASSLTRTTNGGTATNLSLGAITRNVGGTVSFPTPGTGNVTTTSGVTNGLLGGWATIGTNDWATLSSGNLTAATYTNDTWAAGNNTNITGNATVPAGSTTNSLRFATPAASTLTLSGVNTIASGGVLVGFTSAALVPAITGGALRGPAGGDLVIIQNYVSPFTLSSALIDNTGGTGLTKAGAGSLTLSGANPFSGPTYLDAGTTVLANALALQNSTVNLTGGTLDFSGGSGFSASFGALAGSGDLAIQQSGAMSNATFVIAGGNNASTTYSGVLSGVTSGGFTKTGTGTLTFNASTGGSYNGTFAVNGGTLTLDFANLLMPTNLLSSGAALSLGGGTLNLQGQPGASTTSSQTFASTAIKSGSSAIVRTPNGGAAVNLALGALTRSVGGTVDFSAPGSGNITTTSSATSGILGGWATVGGTDWATVSGGNVVAATYTSDTWSSGTNTNVTTSNSRTNQTTNSLRFATAGAQTLTLSGTNTLTSGGLLVTSGVGNNATTITGGTLVGASGADLVVIDNNPSGSLTLASILANNGSATGLTKSGAGTLVISGANTYTGATAINGGVLRLGANNVVPDVSAVSLASGATLDVNGKTETLASVYGAGSITLGAGALTAGADNSSGTLSGVISGVAGSFTKSGTGTLILTGTDTYSGTTTISGGTLQIGNGNAAGALGSGPIVNNGTLVFNRVDNLSVSNSISGNGLVTQNGWGAVLFPVSAVTLGGLSGTGDVAFGSGVSSASLTVGSGNTDTTYSGNLTSLASTQAGGFTKNGTGTLTFSGTMNFGGSSGGALVVNAGTLRVGSDNAFGTTGNGSSIPDWTKVTTVASGATLDLNGHAQTIASLAGAGNVALGAGSLAIGSPFGPGGTTFSGVISGTGSVAVGRGNFVTSFTLTGANNYTGATTISGLSSLTIGNGATAGSIAVASNVVNDGQLTFNRSDAVAFGNTLSGLGSVVQAGGGVLTLSGANSYGGPTIISAGTVAVSADNHLGTTSAGVNFNGGTLRAMADFTSTHNASFGTGGGTFDVLSGVTLTWNGNLSGAAGNNLTKLGLGTLLLGGTNTYSGATLVNAGTLKLTTANAFSPNTTIQVAGGANFDANGFTQTFAGLTGSGNVDLGTQGITVAPAGSNNYTGQLSGSGGLVMGGSGTLTLGNSGNNYSGPTTINSGTVQLGANGALPNGTLLSLGGSGAKLDLNNHPATLGKLEGVAGTTVALGSATLTVAQSSNSTFAGVISGTGGLTKSGAGVLALTGTHLFSGATAINAGEIKLNGSAANSAFTLAGGILSGNATIGALTIGSAGVLSPGNSPGTTNAGATVFDSGGSYQWQINNATVGAGTNQDFLNITGALNITATSGSPFTVSLFSLLPGNTAGNVINFNSTVNTSYTIATASGGIIGYDPSVLTLNTSGFTNSLNGGNWSLGTNGNNLNLNFTASAIPEPSTYAALAGLGALGLALWRRRCGTRGRA